MFKQGLVTALRKYEYKGGKKTDLNNVIAFLKQRAKEMDVDDAIVIAKTIEILTGEEQEVEEEEE